VGTFPQPHSEPRPDSWNRSGLVAFDYEPTVTTAHTYTAAPSPAGDSEDAFIVPDLHEALEETDPHYTSKMLTLVAVHNHWFKPSSLADLEAEGYNWDLHPFTVLSHKVMYATRDNRPWGSSHPY